MSDHERFGTLLASHERSWSLAAATHEEDAERARDRKKREMGQHVNAPADARARMEGVYDAQINKHEKQARVNRRRAEHAQAGFVLHSPDEAGDPEYMRSHQDLISMGHRCGRCRMTDEAVD
jgi:hypothetical protein